MDFTYAYIPIGVPTFELISAQRQFEKSIELLKGIDDSVAVPGEMLLSLDKLKAFLGRIEPDLVIVQNITFANSAYITEVLASFGCPVLLWTLREPVVDGGRLRLNSLTGAYSAANTLHEFGRRFEYVFGSPDEESVKDKISATVKAAKLRKAMQSLNLLSVGHTPQGFGFGRALDAQMRSVFGVNLISIEARELIKKAKGFSDEDAAPFLEKAKASIRGLDTIKEENVRDFAKLFKAYSDYVNENGIGALSSRCWPDFFVSFGTPVCAVLSLLNDLGVPSACEADTFGALSMFACSFLTGKPSFFGDPVHVDEAENTITFWHCGMAPCTLANEKTGARADVHCNRKIGPTLDFACRPSEKATIFRIGRKPDGSFRLFISTGSVPETEKQFNGTSCVVKTLGNAKSIVEESVKDGWEPHFAVATGDCADALKAFGNMLGLEICEY